MAPGREESTVKTIMSPQVPQIEWAQLPARYPILIGADDDPGRRAGRVATN
jgi:hypothetical protein